MGVIQLPEKRIWQPRAEEKLNSSHPLAQSLVFYAGYPFFNDLVGGVDGTVTGATDSGIGPYCGKQFVRARSQNNSYGDLSSWDLGSGNFSFETLFYLNSAASGTTRMQIASKDAASGRQLWLELNTLANNSTDNSAAVVWLNGATLCHTYTPVGSVPAGAWIHLIAQRVGNSVVYYINGELVTTFVIYGSYPAIAATTTPVEIGSRSYSGYRDYFDGIIAYVALRNTDMSADDARSLYDNHWQIFEPEDQIVYFDVGTSGGTTLAGDSSSQTNASGTGSIAQTHVLTGANCAQSNTSSSASISQTHVLTGANSTQTNTASVGVISTNGTIDLTGAGSTQQNTCTGSNISQTHTLTGGDCAQSNTSSTEEMLQTHALTGADCTQNNASSVAAIIAAGTINLSGANASQANSSSVAGIGQTHLLAGSSCVQVNQSSVGAVFYDFAVDSVLSVCRKITTSQSVTRQIYFNAKVHR